VEDPLAPDADEPFIPPRVWTAWPLPPEEVPRSCENISEEDQDEIYTFRRREKEHPSRELVDILTSIALRSAKERFEARETASESSLGDGELTRDIGDSASEHSWYTERDDEIDRDAEPKTRAPTVFVPAIALDDERSADVLRPTIRHILSKLDEVLSALHHARVNCRRYSSSGDADNPEDAPPPSGDEVSAKSVKRPKGRPRKFENVTYRPKADFEAIEEEMSDEGGLRRKKSVGRGRKPKQYVRLDEETNQEYQIRIARLQKKPLPAFAPPRSVSVSAVHSELPMKKPSPLHVKQHQKEAIQKSPQKLELRDWSEVLGAAALVGLPPEIIIRATQRCANLFEEGMTMRTMTEAPFGVEDGSYDTIYRPEHNPDFGSAASGDEVDSESTRNVARSDDITGGRNFAIVDSRFQLRFCPVDDCFRKTTGFSSQSKLQNHLKTQHEMTADEIVEYEVPSDQEMDGAAHVDRFMRPTKRLWRGPDKKKRKRGKRAAKSTS
jgi:hypothetical protein